jgi:NADH-quinone oxidoreductase subunit G
VLYNDRCIMCTRCVRFTREVSGTSELYVDGRGHREEIDIFPGKPCDNKLAGNVVDLCPVGALLDKDFLFKQRVWLLKRTPSISPVDAGGENIWLEYNQGVIYRVKPRYNAEVNTWWISDDTRYSFKAVHDATRRQQPMKTQYGTQVETHYANAIDIADHETRRVHKENGDGSLYAMLSPMMANEEAWLLGTYLRSIDPAAVLVLGPVPTTGQDEVFKNSLTGKTTFTIKAEKVPNAAGIRRVIALLGGPTATWDELVKSATPELKKLKGGWIVGGYLSKWLPKDQPALFKKGLRVVQDILPNTLTDAADVLLPAAAWAEKSGSWENFAGKIQAFDAAIPPPAGAKREGAVYYKLLGRIGVYNADAVRAEMQEPFASVKLPQEDVAEPAYEFVEL